MNYDRLKIENQLCFPLYACAREIVRLYKPFLDEIGLTYTQYIAMMVLWDRKKVTVKQLGEILYLDSGTLTPLLKKMEAGGLLTRNRDKEDERSVIVELTEKGELLKEQAVSIPEKITQCVPINQEEGRQLYHLLYKILGNTGKDLE
ncbi:organic hydroperoxide resistance transcriptional regulator [Lacrimispora amygdalina]|uniref:HTH-type transcriptional regulator SarZ n=1 Tax=Lacrimispora amygdalina TaxID=253257 RepID=A0A3E2NBW9_9FIRM|nr:MarR family transcriptional regulator [Clostridium indicum]RFZ78486.1 MarR family transcriptional regulator [Clostridium indicum]